MGKGLVGGLKQEAEAGVEFMTRWGKRAALAGGAALTTGIGLSVKEAWGFDKAMRYNNTILRAGEKDFERWGEKVKEIAVDSS